MSDIKLFRLSGGTASELQGRASDLEKPLQTLIERQATRSRKPREITHA